MESVLWSERELCAQLELQSHPMIEGGDLGDLGGDVHVLGRPALVFHRIL
jgi:hypothetical protein